jgi:hypothetical protein
VSTPPFAASHPDVFAPQIVPLDLSTDSLSDFAPQAPVAPARLATPLPVVTRGPIVLRVPRWAGVVLLAVAAGAVGSLLTLTMIEGRVANGPADTVAVIQSGAFVEAPAMARPVMPVPARWEQPAMVTPARRRSAPRPAARPAAAREAAAQAPVRAAVTETPRPVPAPPPARPLPTGTVSISSAFAVQVIEDGAAVGDSAGR